jgi:hypothetical protein
MAAFYGSKREIEERYAKIASGEIQPVYLSAEQRTSEAMKMPEKESVKTSKTIYGDVQGGDWVIAAGNNDYEYLIGTVTEIDKLGTPEHGTDNTADDIHVDFTAFDYPPERAAEIEGRFTELCGEPKTFNDIPLDDVIMAPDMLIRITHLGQDEIAFTGNLRHNCEAFCNCFVSPSSGEKFDELSARVTKNLADYHESLTGFGKGELIDMAGKISAMSDAHTYMTKWHEFEDGELDFLLRFQNPLTIIADAWVDRNSDLGDIGYTVEAVCERADGYFESEYPLLCNADAVQTTNEIPTCETALQPAGKPKSLAEKLRAANQKVKEQGVKDAENPKNKKHEER